MKAYITAIFFLLIMGGVMIAAFKAPDILAPYMSHTGAASQVDVRGVVVEKSLDGQKLLVTFDSKDGASLLSFNQRASEIDLLVSKGDTLIISVFNYSPFVTNPYIRKVIKPTGDVCEPKAEPLKQAPSMLNAAGDTATPLGAGIGNAAIGNTSKPAESVTGTPESKTPESKTAEPKAPEKSSGAKAKKAPKAQGPDAAGAKEAGKTAL